MKSGAVGALIVGNGQFIEKKLEERLLTNDIEVKYFEGDWSVFENNFLYVFDFVGNGDVWNQINNTQTKLVLVNLNDNLPWKNTVEILSQFKINWRIINTYGVYGPGMNEKGFLMSAFRQAVENKNLILPSLSINFRLLWVGDLIEAILRSVFLSGTEHEEFLVVGEKYNAKDVAEVLIDEAKMTRHKVMQSEIQVPRWQEDEVFKNWNNLRWQPETKFKVGAKETLQYFFTRIEEERRLEKIKKIENSGTNPSKSPFDHPSLKTSDEQSEGEKSKRQERKKMWEVAVEDETINVYKLPNYKEIPAWEKIENKKFDNEEILAPKKEIKQEETIKEKEEDFEEIKHFKEWKLENEKKEKVVVDGDAVVDKKNSEPVKLITSQDVLVKKTSVFKNYFDKQKEHKKNNHRDKNKKIKWFVLGVVVALLILVSIPVGWMVTGWKSVKTIKATEDLIKTGEYELAEKRLNKSLVKIKEVENKIDDWGLNKTAIFRNYQTALRVIDDATNLELKIIACIDDGKIFNEALFKERDLDWYKQISETDLKINEIISDMGVLRARLDGNWSWAPGIIRSEIQKQAKKLDIVRTDVEILKKAIQILPELVGANGQRKDYLVLFQNESELRAGGGFIGSFGILSFKSGKMVGLEIKDVYEVDGQLKGHVEPPEEINKYLGEAGWFLRDANWQSSWPMAAKDIQWFYEKETSRKVDGVVGINLAVVKMLLTATGEITVPDFKEKISKDNLYEQAEFYAETKFFPGSGQKASFLGGLGKQLFEEIKILDVNGQSKLLTGMLDMLDQNEIQMQINNTEVAKVMAELGWDGAIYQGKCGSERCYSDYLYIVESNFGVNKANYFVNKNLEHQINMSTTAIERVLKINYENTAKTSAWPGGDYKNYLRIYLPTDVMLGEIKVYEPNSKLATIYGQDDIKIKDYEGKKEVGFLVMVPVNSKRIVEIRYNSAISIENLDKFSYLNYIQKQSGSGNIPYVGLISFPVGWQPMQVQPEAEVVNKKVLFNQILNGDLKLGVELGK